MNIHDDYLSSRWISQRLTFYYHECPLRNVIVSKVHGKSKFILCTFPMSVCVHDVRNYVCPRYLFNMSVSVMPTPGVMFLSLWCRYRILVKAAAMLSMLSVHDRYYWCLPVMSVHDRYYWCLPVMSVHDRYYWCLPVMSVQCTWSLLLMSASDVCTC